jgi:hypothetical protein
MKADMQPMVDSVTDWLPTWRAPHVVSQPYNANQGYNVCYADSHCHTGRSLIGYLLVRLTSCVGPSFGPGWISQLGRPRHHGSYNNGVRAPAPLVVATVYQPGAHLDGIPSKRRTSNAGNNV